MSVCVLFRTSESDGHDAEHFCGVFESEAVAFHEAEIKARVEAEHGPYATEGEAVTVVAHEREGVVELRLGLGGCYMRWFYRIESVQGARL